MKTSTAELRALLATGQFGTADLFAFTLVGGTVLRYTAFDTDIVWGGNTFSCGGQIGPWFERQGDKARVAWRRGVEVDTLTFDILPGSATLNGIAFLAAVQRGVFDGATLQLDRAYFASTGTGILPSVVPTGIVSLFAGRISETTAARSRATLTVASHLELLNVKLPRNVYQAGCFNTLYDGACGLVAASYAVAAAVAPGTLASQLYAVLPQATGYFDLGKVVFTGGVNAGVARSIKAHTAGSPASLSLIAPLPAAPAVGDPFTVYPGCDKQQATCSGKFNNLANFRATPFVPAPETAT